MQGLQGPKHLLQPGQALLLLQEQEQQRRSPLQALQVQVFPLELAPPLLLLVVLLQGERPVRWPLRAGRLQFPLVLLLLVQAQLELLRSQPEPLQRRRSNPLLALRHLPQPLRLRLLQLLR